MPSYHEHRASAFPVAIAFGIGTFFLSVHSEFPAESSLIYGVTCFVLIMVGAAVPDVDHQSSIPRRQLGALAGLVALIGYITGTVIISTTISTHFSNPVVGIAAFSVITYIGLVVVPLMLKIIGAMFDSFTTHRGFTHTVFFAILMGGLFYLGLSQVINIPSVSVSFPWFNRNLNISLTDYSKLPGMAAIAIILGILNHIQDDLK